MVEFSGIARPPMSSNGLYPVSYFLVPYRITRLFPEAHSSGARLPLLKIVLNDFVATASTLCSDGATVRRYPISPQNLITTPLPGTPQAPFQVSGTEHVAHGGNEHDQLTVADAVKNPVAFFAGGQNPFAPQLLEVT